jgi:hypothetical protein
LKKIAQADLTINAEEETVYGLDSIPSDTKHDLLVAEPGTVTSL